MAVVPLSKPANESRLAPDVAKNESTNWVAFAAGGSLVAAGLLLISGERRAGMVAAATGTALAMLDEQETLRSWWTALPGYIDQVQRVVVQVQNTVDEVAVKREALRRALAR